jgi:hypothetical protein
VLNACSSSSSSTQCGQWCTPPATEPFCKHAAANSDTKHTAQTTPCC